MTEDQSSSTPSTTSSWGRAPLNAEDYSSLTDTQEKILSLLPLIPATLSIWGSANIIHMVLTSTKKTTPYRRILLALSICDLINSIVYPFQSFLLPADTSQRVWAVGTDATCTMMGWFNQFNFSSIWYSGMISIYFLLTVRFGKSEHWIASRVEPMMHLLSIAYPLVTASIGAALNMYHEFLIGTGCWIYEYPEGCQDCSEFPDTDRPCCEGSFYAWVFGGLPTFFMLLVIGICNALVYCHVRSTIRTSQQYLNSSLKTTKTKQQSKSSQPPVNSRIHSQQVQRIQAVGTQALLYVGAFALTYACALSFKIMESLDYNAQDEDTLFPGLVVHQLTLPGLGFLNCLVFVRPSYMRVRKRHPNESRFWAFRRALHGDKIRASQVQTQTQLSQQTQQPHLQLQQELVDNQRFDKGNASGNNDNNKAESSLLSPPPLQQCPALVCQSYQDEEEESIRSFELDISECEGSIEWGSKHYHDHQGYDYDHIDKTIRSNRYHQSAPQIHREELLSNHLSTRRRMKKNRFIFNDVLFDDGTDDDPPQQEDDGHDDDEEKQSSNKDTNFQLKDGCGHMSLPTLLTTVTTTSKSSHQSTLNKHNSERNARLQERISFARNRYSLNNKSSSSSNNNNKVAAVVAAVAAGLAEEVAPAPPPRPPLPNPMTTTGHFGRNAWLSSKTERPEKRENTTLSKEAPIQQQQTRSHLMVPPATVSNNNNNNNSKYAATPDEFFEDEGDQQCVDNRREESLPTKMNYQSSSSSLFTVSNADEDKRCECSV